MTGRGQRILRSLALAIPALALAAGCSDADRAIRASGSPAPAVQTDAAAQALVPAPVRERGVLRVAMMNNYKPYSYNEAGKQVGVLPEMVTAVAQTMGLEAEITAVDFPSILTGLQAQRYDIGMGEYFVREDRLQVADFVTEWSNYDSFIVRESGDYQPASPPTSPACPRRSPPPTAHSSRTAPTKPFTPHGRRTTG
ncbi:transporter substrate-binding domain-containing protein [Amycolatopsis sp. K13G38]|uniref:Transporter substrate-binding domain-containing protein n=1 Tax=Amycolatopsis acididurans TaxID=2724524 RepID=A0ABX1JER2_9PSEU|nr:transporter substrate-binding domain-containing protein [Amycolatopsis acididurans]NKQ57716.1 transporter substrate-binding domain-containing protein [Amycolatopsis acididurans]